MIATKNIHAAKTQLYRWFNGYERPFTIRRIVNQVDILVTDIFIKLPNGEINGHKEYRRFLSNYRGMRISHELKNVEIVEQQQGQLALSVDLIYHGIQKNGEENCLIFHYENKLMQEEGHLPLFKELNLSVAGLVEKPLPFQDSYPTFRMMSLMHYWLFNMEHLDGNIVPFKEILTEDFVLNLSPTTKISSIEGLEKWLKTVPTQMEVTNHYPKNVAVKVLSENTFQLEVTFDWEGVTKNQEKMMATTRHTWVAKDELKLRFAKIQRMDVEYLAPFAVVK